jgi:hypothetical protein
VFIGSRSIPQPKWGYSVVKKDLRMLQPLCEAVQRLLHGGLMGADLLRTFFSHWIQPLYQQEMTMWMYLGPSCPDRPFSELGDTEINTRIHGVLAHGAVLNLGPGLVPLREGVDIPWVSPLKPAFGCLCQFRFHNIYVFLHRVSSVFTVPHGGHLT